MAKEQNFQIQKEPALNPKACDAASAFGASVEQKSLPSIFLQTLFKI